MRHFALAIPFLLGAFGMRAAVVPVGDSIAAALVAVAPSLPHAGPHVEANETGEMAATGETGATGEAGETAQDTLEPAAGSGAGGGGGEGYAVPRLVSRRLASRGAPGRRHLDASAVVAVGVEAPTPALDAPVKGTIVIPASAVKKAIERKDVGATSAKGPDGAPLGARLTGVGKYGLGLRDGDVVVAVQGTRTPTVQAMVGAAMGAASGGATRLSGRILRGGVAYAVVLEIPRD
jgi:hypothetical protein